MNTLAAGKPIDVQQMIAAHRSGAVNRKAPVENRSLSASENKQGKSADFSEVFRSSMEGVRFSAHAATRIKSRNIEMTPEIMGKLEKAVSGAAGKGARDSLIIMKNLAFIVNIPNRTVITAMDGESIKENIFTNIDSAVIAD